MLVHLFLLLFLASAVNSLIPAEYFRLRRLDFRDFTRNEVTMEVLVHTHVPIQLSTVFAKLQSIIFRGAVR